MAMESPRIQRALISVSDKSGLAEFARRLVAQGVAIYSTGGTARFLTESGLEVHDVSAYTQFPEMMGGRLKTLHPKVFGGILWRPDHSDDAAALAEHEMVSFELVVVNLYPFEATVARTDATEDQIIEQVDIGGPSLVRAAAKNHRYVTIATDPGQYGSILEQLEVSGTTTLPLRQQLAAAALARTAAYDTAISGYFARWSDSETLPTTLALNLRREAPLRYGENPQQQAALYRSGVVQGANVLDARQLNGKELSYNNLLDLDSALAIVRGFSEPAVAVIKHNNPCGAAVADSLRSACQKALEGDAVSAFGSILAANRTVDVETATFLCTPGLFVEAFVAPAFDPEALKILQTKPKWRANVRLLEVGELTVPRSPLVFRSVEGGMLVQTNDFEPSDPGTWQVVTNMAPTEEQRLELEFAWEVCRHVKSNAIVLTKGLSVCGVGAGQMSRVDAVEIGIQKAADRAVGAVLASDAFFPFPDSILRAARAGIVGVVQPGGSKGDAEVIAACNEAKIPMLFTGRRHFRH